MKDLLFVAHFMKWYTNVPKKHKIALTDSGIGADGPGDLVNVGIGGLAQRGYGVDGGHTLGQISVGDQLTQLGGPQVRGDDLRRRNPVGVHCTRGKKWKENRMRGRLCMVGRET